MHVLTLLPLSLEELSEASLLPEKIEVAMYQGSYPKLYAEKVSVDRLYANYIRLYIERDVRQIKNVANLATFQRFMQLCAGRIGQVVNLASLGNDCGVNHSTIKAWLSLLEASYIIHLLYPYYKNYGKRLIKAPKLYFVDTGIACSLLKIRSPEELADHYLRGGLTESYIIADLLKQQHNMEQQPSLYFWRDHAGREIDCIIDTAQYPVPVEIKAGKTVTTDFFKELRLWHTITNSSQAKPYLVYGGEDDQAWPEAQVLSWQSAGLLIKGLV